MRLSLAAIGFLLLVATAATAAPTPTPTPAAAGGSMMPGGNSKDPISIEADKLVYSERDQRAVYYGNVIAIQGPTKLICSVMTLLLDKSGATPTPTPTLGKPAVTDNASSGANSQVRHMDCAGPATVISKTQTATGDSAAYDRPENKWYMIGNVTFSDGQNVTKGDKLTYDLITGRATVENGGAKTKVRVQSQFVPGSSGK